MGLLDRAGARITTTAEEAVNRDVIVVVIYSAPSSIRQNRNRSMPFSKWRSSKAPAKCAG